MAALYWSWV